LPTVSPITSTGTNVIGLLTAANAGADQASPPGALKPFENQIGVETMPTRYLRYRRMRRESLDDYPLSLFRAP